MLMSRVPRAPVCSRDSACRRWRMPCTCARQADWPSAARGTQHSHASHLHACNSSQLLSSPPKRLHSVSLRVTLPGQRSGHCEGRRSTCNHSTTEGTCASARLRWSPRQESSTAARWCPLLRGLLRWRHPRPAQRAAASAAALRRVRAFCPSHSPLSVPGDCPARWSLVHLSQTTGWPHGAGRRGALICAALSRPLPPSCRCRKPLPRLSPR